jgi:hypothetical protein
MPPSRYESATVAPSPKHPQPWGPKCSGRKPPPSHRMHSSRPDCSCTCTRRWRAHTTHTRAAPAGTARTDQNPHTLHRKEPLSPTSAHTAHPWTRMQFNHTENCDVHAIAPGQTPANNPACSPHCTRGNPLLQLNKGGLKHVVETDEWRDGNTDQARRAKKMLAHRPGAAATPPP